MENVNLVYSVLAEDVSFNDKAIAVQNQIADMDGVLTDEKEIEKTNPLEHTFADGMYVRKIFMPAGQVIISKTHKQKHPYFILSGVVSVASEEGVEKITAPYSGITEAGTKRILYIHEDTTWVTVQRTEKTDVDEITKDLVSHDFHNQLT